MRRRPALFLLLVLALLPALASAQPVEMDEGEAPARVPEGMEREEAVEPDGENAEEEEELNILPEKGLYLEYGEGFLNLRIDPEGYPRIYFLGEKREVLDELPLGRARLDFEDFSGGEREGSVLLEKKEDSLRGVRRLYPPYDYWVRIVLLKETGEGDYEAGEIWGRELLRQD